MPEKKTLDRARRDRRRGKSASTQAGEFVREEIEHVREGKHGARSTKQAIAIGLSKARRAGVKLSPPARGRTSSSTRRQAERDLARGEKRAARPGSRAKKTSVARSRGAKRALAKEGRSAASPTSLARQGRAAARKRTAAERSASAKKAARTRKASRRK
ncbi:DNA-binding protein [Candidatus Binatia bacterium]|jgi:hypothetical protein|nr:DNA-binding protein [Candidatus Binatia bacterium]